MTDEQIIKCLECCASEEENACDDCYCANGKCIATTPYVLDLINRLNSENEILRELNQQVRKEKNKLMDAQLFLAKNCDELQEENDRLQAEIARLQKLCDSRKFVLNGVLDKLIDDAIKQEEHLVTMSNDMIKTIETAKTIAIKEFAERLKGKKQLVKANLNDIGECLLYGVLCGDIDNLVKEMVGEE